MANGRATSSMSTSRLILFPAVITLGITILRLVGELQHWPKSLSNPNAGGPGAIIGIAWLPFIFGPYFALKLAAPGQGPERVEQALGMRYWALSCVALGFYLFNDGIIRRCIAH